MRPTRHHLLPIAVAALASGCATLRPHAADMEFRGRYTAGFEVSRFSPCAGDPADGPWWVTLSATALRQRDSLVALLPDDAGRELFVRWRGVVGDPTTAGHLGQYRRYLHVAVIEELRAVEAGDCGDPAWRRLSIPPAR